MKQARILIALALWLAIGPARADGGRVVLQAPTGDLRVTLLAAPIPLRAGPAELSVLVQDEDGTPVLDAEVDLLLSPPHGGAPFRVAPQGPAQARLFAELPLHLESPGTWHVQLTARRANTSARLEGAFVVAEPLGNARRHWAAITLGPLGALVIAMHQARVWQLRQPRTRRENGSAV